jgi:hypothetical protein
MEVTMRKFYAVFIAILLFPFLAQAAHVFIWNYDPKDKFYESEISDSVDCAYWLEQTLNTNEHTFNTDTLLPTDLSPYDVVLVTVGWFRC